MSLSWGSGPLAEAARRLAPANTPPVAAATDGLAAVLDLPGSVLMAERLADWDFVALPTTHPEAAERVQAALERLDRIDRRLERFFADAFKPRYGIPQSGSMYRILEATGALEERKGAPLARATRSLWGPFGQFMDAGLSQSRRELGGLRDAVGPELRLLGKGAARLETLDGMLAEATQNRVVSLVLRLRGAAEARFRDDLKAAVRALPESPTEAHVKPWLAAGAWVPAFVDELRRAVLAVHDHHRNLVEALIEACLASREEP